MRTFTLEISLSDVVILTIALIMSLTIGLNAFFAISYIRAIEAENADLKEAYELKEIKPKRYLERER